MENVKKKSFREKEHGQGEELPLYKALEESK